MLQIYEGSGILSLRLNRGGNAECRGSFTCTNLKTYPRDGSGDIAGLEVHNSSACPNGF